MLHATESTFAQKEVLILFLLRCMKRANNKSQSLFANFLRGTLAEFWLICCLDKGRDFSEIFAKSIF